MFGGHIDRRETVVDNQYRPVAEQGPGQGQPLPLPAGEFDAPFTGHGVVAIFQCESNIFVDCSIGGGLANLFPDGLWATQRNIGGDGIGKEYRFLADIADMGADIVSREELLTSSASKKETDRRCHGIEPGQNFAKSRFTGTGPSGYPVNSRSKFKGNIVQDGFSCSWVAKMQVLQLKCRLRAATLFRCRGSGRSGCVPSMSMRPSEVSPRCTRLATQPMAIIGQISM